MALNPRLFEFPKVNKTSYNSVRKAALEHGVDLPDWDTMMSWKERWKDGSLNDPEAHKFAQDYNHKRPIDSEQFMQRHTWNTRFPIWVGDTLNKSLNKIGAAEGFEGHYFFVSPGTVLPMTPEFKNTRAYTLNEMKLPKPDSVQLDHNNLSVELGFEGINDDGAREAIVQFLDRLYVDAAATLASQGFLGGSFLTCLARIYGLTSARFNTPFYRENYHDKFNSWDPDVVSRLNDRDIIDSYLSTVKGVVNEGLSDYDFNLYRGIDALEESEFVKQILLLCFSELFNVEGLHNHFSENWNSETGLAYGVNSAEFVVMADLADDELPSLTPLNKCYWAIAKCGLIDLNDDYYYIHHKANRVQSVDNGVDNRDIIIGVINRGDIDFTSDHQIAKHILGSEIAKILIAASADTKHRGSITDEFMYLFNSYSAFSNVSYPNDPGRLYGGRICDSLKHVLEDETLLNSFQSSVPDERVEEILREIRSSGVDLADLPLEDLDEKYESAFFDEYVEPTEIINGIHGYIATNRAVTRQMWGTYIDSMMLVSDEIFLNTLNYISSHDFIQKFSAFLDINSILDEFRSKKSQEFDRDIEGNPEAVMDSIGTIAVRDEDSNFNIIPEDSVLWDYYCAAAEKQFDTYWNRGEFDKAFVSLGNASSLKYLDDNHKDRLRNVYSKYKLSSDKPMAAHRIFDNARFAYIRLKYGFPFGTDSAEDIVSTFDPTFRKIGANLSGSYEEAPVVWSDREQLIQHKEVRPAKLSSDEIIIGFYRPLMQSLIRFVNSVNGQKESRDRYIYDSGSFCVFLKKNLDEAIEFVINDLSQVYHKDILDKLVHGYLSRFVVFQGPPPGA